MNHVALYLGVGLLELVNRHAVFPGDGGEAFPRGHGVGFGSGFRGVVFIIVGGFGVLVLLFLLFPEFLLLVAAGVAGAGAGAGVSAAEAALLRRRCGNSGSAWAPACASG